MLGAGRYNLVAVLTHKGRSADSGHYVSWVKQADGTWIQFDDEELIPRKEDEIPSLSGGGDWHMAYLLLYEAERVP
jgi:ubiquitin carboxyl-terminal hydrolase 14